MSAALEDVLGEIFDLALVEPAVGHTFWSFHEKDRPSPLEFDEVLARLTSGRGVYAIELVFDEELELFQRGSGKKIKDARALLALKSERVDALAHAPPLPKVSAPVAASTERKGPLHAALLSVDDGAASGAKKPAKKQSAAALAAKKAASRAKAK